MKNNIWLVPLREGYLTFTPDTEVELARRVFRDRFGYEAEKAVVEQGLLWVGPLSTDAVSGFQERIERIGSGLVDKDVDSDGWGGRV